MIVLIVVKESNTRYPAELIVNHRTRITKVPAQTGAAQITADQTIQVLCHAAQTIQVPCHAAIYTLGISSNFNPNTPLLEYVLIQLAPLTCD